jgi:predicted transcriptional regulator
MAGFIVLPRFFDKDWGRGNRPLVSHTFIKTLFKANYKDIVWRGIVVERGSFITSISEFSSEIGLTPHQTRECLRVLKGDNLIDIQTSKLWTKIIVCNYDSYQAIEKRDGNSSCDVSEKDAVKEDVKENATRETNNKEQKIKDKNMPIVSNKEAIDRIYALYPTKCPVRNASTAKSFKCKEKIERLLRDHTEEELTYIIKRYLEETLGKHYLKDFSTLLNNLPDYGNQGMQAQPMSARDIEWERTKRDNLKEEAEARERSRLKLEHDIAAGIVKLPTHETDGSLNL